MAKLSIDEQKVVQCRKLAKKIAREVQGFIDRHTTVGVERTVARAYGVAGTDDEGTPLANTLVDRVNKAGLLQYGVTRLLAQELIRGATSMQQAAELIAYDDKGPSLDAKITLGD